MGRRFRNTMTSMSGHDAARVVQGRVVGVNMVNWTVDVRSQYDRLFWADIQVSSTYQHFNNGEGLYCMPEIGADCMVVLPSDSSPPFVMSFVMPHEEFDTSSAEAPQGTTSHGTPGKSSATASFAGGRPKAKPGDIIMRTRDGNYVILHRGGVLQLGATPMAQRIYIPIGNIITDISEQYYHHNVMGSVSWGIQEGPTEQNIPGQWTQTFRVNADDKYADVRVRVGKVVAISEPASGNQSEIDQLDLGKSAPIVYEVVIAQGGFNEDGSPSSSETAGAVKMRYFFDRAGGMFLRSEGNALIAFHKKLYLIVGEDLTIKGKTADMSFTDGCSINGGSSLTLKGKVVRINGGKKAVATVGSMVNVSVKLGMVLPGLVAPSGGGPVTGVLNLQNLMVGVVSSGDGTVLAGN